MEKQKKNEVAAEAKKTLRKVSMDVKNGHVSITDGTISVSCSLEQVVSKYKGAFLGDCRRILDSRKIQPVGEFTFEDVFPERSASVGSKKVNEALEAQKASFISALKLAGKNDEEISAILSNM